MARYIKIENASAADKSKIKQDLKYRTGKFIWKVAFNIDLDSQSVNNENVKVTTKSGIPVNTKIRFNSLQKCIEIEPLEAYSENESYILHVSTKVQSKSGKHLANELNVQFKI